ncbi:methyl-accepting chemotaxis protein [Thalassotalea sediminis]|uniref:methyl-accepting chemotaxis protein n=1 Tax=Thalassotalea sediminis TaxID=1759089 RepID=UPI00257379D8|nr:PAS domain-containing methyl-accepting chemotaxis protein [Thalassotalea sediminis]
MNKEQVFSQSEILLSTTDLNSHIKYANDNFCNIAGYSLEEMVGQPHNMVRHPDMPKAAFANLWQHLKSGKSWMGPVKNKCKNGDYYWVNAFVTPIKDNNGKVKEYQSVRTCPDRDVVKRAEQAYAQLNQGKAPKKLTKTTDKSIWFHGCFIAILLLTIINVISTGTDIIAMTLCVVAFCSTLLYTQWQRTYKKVADKAKKIYDNPLMTYLYAGNNDLIGTIEVALEKRQLELNAIVGRVCDISSSITEIAHQSSQRGQNIATILSNQKSETAQVATAANEMSTTVKDITFTVKEAAKVTQQGLNISNQGRLHVDKATEAINQLSNQLAQVDQAINKLTVGCRSIESISNEISSIADQTNLLALNAAIEAARAGEQGRGFAVVAEEVRALAKRTQQSTEEINTLLDQLQKESDIALHAMNEGNQLSQNCVSLSEKTGVSLQQISQEVHDLVAISEQIAAAITQQSAAAEDVNQNVTSISDMSSESELHGNESVKLSNYLLDQLTEQQNLINQFKL